MFDYSDENMYSDHMVKQVSWLRYYARFYTHSLLFCDCKWPDLVNASREDKTGSTGKSEPMLIKAVTGKDISFAEGVELGKKIWNLDHAIWTLQGRHRDMVHFTDNMYTENGAHGPVIGLKDGKWERLKVSRHLDRDRFEDFKTRFYKMQGWDTASGFPTRTTLAGMGMSNVADELEAHGKLGA
jgi:aldehyde:ferredoxin oxidoreductase